MGAPRRGGRAVQPHFYPSCRRGRCPPAPLTKSLPLLWHQGTRLHKSTAYKRRGHPEPRRCASAKVREIPHPTEGRKHPVSTRRASAGCEACRTQSCLRGVGAKPAPTSPLIHSETRERNPQGRQARNPQGEARIYAPEREVLGNPQHAPACVIHSMRNPQGRQARIYAPEHEGLGNPQHAPACLSLQ